MERLLASCSSGTPDIASRYNSYMPGHRFADLKGVYAPILTPFRPEDGEVEYTWMARHLGYLRAHGCTGIVPCGTNGEAPSLSVAERMRVVETAIAAAGGMPVIAGTGAAALPDAVALTRHAFAAGANGVLILPPFYFKRPADAALAAWYQRLFDAAVPAGALVLLYHIPQLSAIPITNGLLELLMRSHGELIFGVKDSTGDPAELQRFRTGFPELIYYAGSDHRVAEACLAGGAGSISAWANVFPDLIRDVQQAAWIGHDPAAAQARLSEARRCIDPYPMQAAVKHAVRLVAGLPATAVRPPQAELTAPERASLSAVLASKLPDWRPEGNEISLLPIEHAD
jgi:4-hydroxy-tetrahydrodipicolinate synthase